jgi:hypothetical protein
MGAPLVGFTGDKICPVGIVTLPITIGTYPKQVCKTSRLPCRRLPLNLQRYHRTTNTQPITSSDLYLPPLIKFQPNTE